MKEYILLFNGRRRVYMVNRIKKYLRRLKLDIGIYVTDTDNLDPVGYYADKFSIVPINDGAKLEPDTHYVVTTGNDKFKIVLSNEDGTLCCPGVKAYLPILSRDIASKIFVKYHKLERKLEKMKKDFE